MVQDGQTFISSPAKTKNKGQRKSNFFFSIAKEAKILDILKRKDKKFLSGMNIISIFNL